MSEWHDALGEPTIADAILDRLVHNAHRIELHGDSLRRADDAAERTAMPDDSEKRTKPPERRKRGGSRAAETP